MIVIDASALIEVLKLTEVGLQMAPLLVERELHAPHLLDLEIMQALRRLTLRGEMTPAEARRALASFLEMTITRHPHTDLLPGIWALRHNLTAYDAAYLVLARLLDAKLLTMDSALRKLAGG